MTTVVLWISFFLIFLFASLSLAWLLFYCLLEYVGLEKQVTTKIKAWLRSRVALLLDLEESQDLE